MVAVRYPARVALARAATPLQRLSRLEVPGGPALWVKRDDLTGFGTSGNKIRKLEFLLADALAQGADTLVTCGGVQSNHCRATALLCAEQGLRCELILRGEFEEDRPEANLFIDRLCGAGVRILPSSQYLKRFDALLAELLEYLRHQGRKPYFIPTGGSNAVGVWGYVRAAEELLADMQAAGFRADAVVHATGSGGTQSGLIAGFALHGQAMPVWGVNVCDDRATFEAKIASDLADWQQRYTPPMATIQPESIHILEGYRGPAYAVPTEETLTTIRLAARSHGLLLDPVYSGKAFQGLLSECRPGGRFAGMKHVIFVHTGGFFGSFAQCDTLLGQSASL